MKMIEFVQVKATETQRETYGEIFSKGEIVHFGIKGELVTHYDFKIEKQQYVKCGHTVFLACPDCGKPTRLIDHEIDSQGVVKPSVVSQTSGCKFHGMVKLLDWNAGKSDR